MKTLHLYYCLEVVEADWMIRLINLEIESSVFKANENRKI